MFGHPQEIEEAEYGDGYGNEFARQAAWETIKWNANPDRQATAQKIADAVEAGKFVAVIRFPKLCPSTDAIIGTDTSLVAICDTYEEASAALEGRGDYEDRPEVVCKPSLRPVPPQTPVETFTDGDIPF
jgi:hypothetical protein